MYTHILIRPAICLSLLSKVVIIFFLLFVHQEDNLYIYWPVVLLPLASLLLLASSLALIKPVIVQTDSSLIISNLFFQPAHCPLFN